MKVLWFVLGMGICGLVAFYMINAENRKRRAEEHRYAELERQRENERMEKARQEDERIRKERMAALAKDDAVLMLQRYITREESALKDTIEECKLKLSSIGIDQECLSTELVALEKEEELKAKDAKRRGAYRRDKNERVDALLKSPTLNRLAAKYLGEDFSALHSEYRSHVGNLAKISDEKTRRYRANREKYQKSQAKSDEEVEKLTYNARRELGEARARMEANLDSLRNRASSLKYRIEKLEKKGSVTTLNKKEKEELESLRTQYDIASAQLTSAEATSGLGKANRAHLDLTVAETKARRDADTALSVRMDDDNAVEAEMNREAQIFNVVKNYEARSLDRVRDAMLRAKEGVESQMSGAERKLKYLAGSIANLDMLNAEEVSALRKAIAKKLSDGVSSDNGHAIKVGD